MTEAEIRLQIEQVRSGLTSRRVFVQRLADCGIGLPTAGMLLLHAGVATAQTEPFVYKPMKRGGGGTVRIIRADAPTLLNPHFGIGVKDNYASRIFCEPLAQWDADATLVPVLAAEIPTRENGGLAADGRSVVWTLKRGVTWHDGEPFTADDVVFNWQYATDPAAAAVTSGNFAGLMIEKLDSHRVRVVFDKPTPFWPGTYSVMQLIPRHRFAAFTGARSREARENLAPVGTGPYRFVEFRPGDFLRAELYANYHQRNRPHFDRLELKGGGDALSAARTVLQTGDFDLAADILADDELLRRMEASRGKGRVEFSFAHSTTALYLNATDPALEIDGERNSLKSRHPLWSDPALRRAFALTVDRATIQQLFGRQGQPTGNWVNQPTRYRAEADTEFNLDKARQLLERAGWVPGTDGVRVKGGRRLAVTFQGAASPVVEKYMAVVKSNASKAGFSVDLKTIAGSVFFSSDAGNLDTIGRFNADVQTFNWTSNLPDPRDMCRVFLSSEIPTRANKWLGLNQVRWQSADYDAAFNAAEAELDPVKRTALFVRMNELVAQAGYAIPILTRATARVVTHSLHIPFSAWRHDTASLADWYRES